MMKRKRIQKTSIYILCEGKTEVAFLNYIKKLCPTRHKSIFIRDAKGDNSLKNMRKKIANEKDHRQIDKAYIFLDGDQIDSENIQSTDVLISEPCIEGFFLKILTDSKPQTSRECKRKFEKEYLNKTDKLDHRTYKKHFREDVLERRRYDIPLLHAILKIFE